MIYSKDEIPPEVAKAFVDLARELYEEDKTFRYLKMPTWKRNEAFWNGIQRAVYSIQGRTYISLSELGSIADLSSYDAVEYERIINFYKAHGESFIAALSASIPNAVFHPDDSDSPDDLSTSKTYRRIADLIEIYNDAALRFVKILYYLYNFGVCYFYSAYDRNKKYGTINRPQFDYKEVKVQNEFCPICGNELESSSMMGGLVQCQSCGNEVEPEVQESTEQVPYITSEVEVPKGQAIIEIYSPINVTIPTDSRDPKHVNYLRLDMDLDRAEVMEIYGVEGNWGTDYTPDKLNRIAANSVFADNRKSVNVSRIWYEPWMFNRMPEDIRDQIKQMFPNGAYIVLVNDEVVEACDESLQDVWTIAESPISDILQADPYGNCIIPLQTMMNDLIELTMENIESNVPINFYDPFSVDPKKLKDNFAQPGDWVPAKSKPGMDLGRSFFTTPPTTLSKDIPALVTYLKESMQFCLGTLPSVYGGAAEAGSKTLGEYRESRANALQRLSIPWKVASNLWVNGIHKCVNLYIDNLLEGQDEKYTKQVSASTFVTVWIKQAELKGRIGQVSVENSEQLPVSWNQRKSLIFELLQNKDPQLASIIYHPENVNVLADVLGTPDLYIPGCEDREKQLREIQEMAQAEPQQPPDMMDETGAVVPQPQMSSIPIDPEVDNHLVHIETIRAFLVSEIGLVLKRDNPSGYSNILAHLQEHNAYLQSIQPPPMEGQNGNSGESGNPQQ